MRVEMSQNESIRHVLAANTTKLLAQQEKQKVRKYFLIQK